MNDSEKIKDLQIDLASLYHDYGVDIPHGMWASEKDRWEELLVCVINQINSEPNMEEIRSAINMLGKLNLASPNVLGELKPESEEYILIAFIFQRFNFTDQESIRALNTIIALSKIVNGRFEGKIQRLLRIYFDQMRKDMCETFANIGLTSGQIRYAVSHWLQNSSNAPISIEHKAIQDYCIETGSTQIELANAADELDINLAIIDDLLEKRLFVRNTESGQSWAEQESKVLKS